MLAGIKDPWQADFAMRTSLRCSSLRKIGRALHFLPNVRKVLSSRLQWLPEQH